MKVLGFMPIHYGIEYLKESLLSIKDHVDGMVISYTHKPSHGFKTILECPDKAEDIRKICEDVLGDKLIWDEAEFYGAEFQHRNVAKKYSQGFDLIISIDADEVFEPTEIEIALKYAYTHNERYYGIKGYLNFWRSFNWICLDGFRPIRIENLNRHNSLQNLECPLTIYHFSTAQKREIMEYKYSCFGHANEIKKDYLENVFYKWTPENNFGDLHPVSLNLWNAIKYDKNKLPNFMHSHPNFNKLLI
jgi:hypothetical protein